MKRNYLILMLLPALMLTSCQGPIYVEDYFIDSNYNLRVIPEPGYAVDEYYYNEDKYDGEITIDITIPESINNQPIRTVGKFGYDKIITDGKVKYEHDEWKVATLTSFAIICYSYFEEDTIININIDIQADLYLFQILNDLNSFYNLDDSCYIYFFNNNDLYSDDNYQIISNCNLNIFITGTSKKFYAVDGEIYERWPDGKDHKLSIKNPEIRVYGNLLNDDEDATTR